MAKKFLILLFPLLFSSCFREDLKLPFKSMEPPALDDGWQVASPAEVGMDSDALRQIFVDFHEDTDLWQVRSLLVVKDGKLVAETYTKDPSELQRSVPVWSCTKQVLALLVGIALDSGSIRSLSDTLGMYLPAAREYPDKSAIRLDDLLTMRSGIGFENEGFNGHTNLMMRGVPENSLDFILSLPSSNRGASFHYNDGDPHLMSAVLQTALQKPLSDWANSVLFDKIGIRNIGWIAYKDGITMGAFGISATARDLARFGQLVLSDGMWNGRQIVSKEWVRDMASVHVNASDVGFNQLSFGYYWWIDTRRNVALMDGKGGQYVFVDRANHLLVVITSDPNDAQGLPYPTAATIYDAVVWTIYP